MTGEGRKKKGSLQDGKGQKAVMDGKQRKGTEREGTPLGTRGTTQLGVERQAWRGEGKVRGGKNGMGQYWME